MANKYKLKVGDDINQLLDKILDEEVERLGEVVEKVTEKTRKGTLKLIKERSPVSARKLGKRKRRYSQDWYSKKEKGKSIFADVIIGNKQYRLTHLLENGHFIFNKYGGAYGHTKPKPHILPTQDEVSKNYEEDLVKEIEKL